VGEGAPNATAAQAFQDAVTRNRLALQLPGRYPVRRAGNGYVQEVATANGARVVLALPDRVAQAFVLAGALLARYEDLRRTRRDRWAIRSRMPAPGDARVLKTGRWPGCQVRLVAGALLTRWQALGLEGGALGSPVSEGAGFFTFAATSGTQQAFRSGALYSIPLAGRVAVHHRAHPRQVRANGRTRGAFGRAYQR
jgi:hypothetical protein